MPKKKNYHTILSEWNMFLVIRPNTFLFGHHHIYLLRLNFANLKGFPCGTSGKEPACKCMRHKRHVWSLGQEDTLKKGKAIHSSILAWKIWTEEPGGLQSTGSQRVRHDWSDSPVQFSHSALSDSLWPHGLQPARLPCPWPTPRDCSK